MRLIFFLFLLPLAGLSQTFSGEEAGRWKQQAGKVTIIRDNWGVPHIYGKKDTDAIFGLLYAQCEDNFWQLEETLVSKMGRRAELIGTAGLANDISIAMLQIRKRARESYEAASPSAKAICRAAADAVNFYLYTHPGKARLFQRFEPWYFTLPVVTDLSVHGITPGEMLAQGRITAAEGIDEAAFNSKQEDGSNTIAIAPKKSASGNAMLVINPHQPFFGDYQRYECQLVSEEGLNAGGFGMLGLPFIWSGFNEFVAWAHTNSGVDFTDVYLETFDHPTDSLKYRYGAGYRTAVLVTDTVFVKTASGLSPRPVSFRLTHHGPVLARRGGQWITAVNSSAPTDKWIDQCWQMMKAKNLKTFTAAMDKRALGYPTTSYADRDGNIAYWHGNAVPRRDPKYDWRYPQQGNDPGTEWKELHPLRDVPQVINPATGWLQNCNSTPYLSAGASSPQKQQYPAYMAYDPQTFRAEEALRQLSQPGRLSLDDLRRLITSPHLPLMANWKQQIIDACERTSVSNPGLRQKFSFALDSLRNWDNRYGPESRATTIAMEWTRNFLEFTRKTVPLTEVQSIIQARVSGARLPVDDSLTASFMSQAIDTLLKRYGSIPQWGDINRLQRIHSSGTQEKFSDDRPSLAVAAAPGVVGSLFAFGTRRDGTKKNYGTGGNTYVALIEMGKRIKVRSVFTFGQSADPASPHYFDQGPLYAAGQFKEVWFYKEDVLKHTERTYHPGE
ncbi:MAG TPA: penicillin acylase family protein [Flavisolibacter sp.]|nr:penicillin acylase family protein [Flavisolibacter sp.]